MGTDTAAPARLAIPQQKDGRAELLELAAALSQQVDHRHRTRGAHEFESNEEPTRYNLTTPETVPPPRPRQDDTKLLRRFVPLAIAAALTGAVSVAGWTATHSNAATAKQPPAPAAKPLQTQENPTTAAEWGAQAHQRLSRAGRPVDVFACQGAYAADATMAPDTLPPAATSPAAWQAYLATCLSDMSGARVSHSG